MKKIFLFIPTMLLAAMVSAKEIRISSATSNIIAATIDDAGTEDGDVIVLTDNGPYVNIKGSHNYTYLNKSVTIKADPEADPAIQPVIKFEIPFYAKSAASVKFIGVKFDGTNLTQYDRYIYFSDNSDNRLEFEDCEFTAISKYIMQIGSGYKAASIIINNCNFHDNTNRGILNQGTLTNLEINDSKFKNFTGNYSVIDNYGATIGTLQIDDCEFSGNTYPAINGSSSSSMTSCAVTDCYFHDNNWNCIYLENSSEMNLSISNSTFANNNSALNSSGIVESKNTTGSVLVNHCTFYNCPINSTSYGTVKFVSPNAVVSNSIFVMPSSINQRAIHMPNGNDVNNCLTYNYTYDGDGIRSGIDKTACVTGNPYFMNTNPANYDFTIWTTSPAHETADDGEDLGDYLRWNTDPATHVATINITAEDDNSLKAAIDAALPGDEIILAAGTYEESESISLDKEITIKAAVGAHPIVKPVGNFALSNAADITIENIKFDGSDQTASNFIYAVDATNNSLTIEGCEFYSFAHPLIYAESSKLIGTCSVNNCQFYNNTHSCIGLKNSAAANLTVTNSTFNNNDASGVGDGNGIGIVESKTATGTMLVDHCTFYNCKVLNTDFGITKVASPNAMVSNCIFDMPASTSGLRTVYIPSGLSAGTTVTNCVMHYFTHDSNIGVPERDGAIIANCSTADPLFTDAANGDFTFPYDWSTGAFSPAYKAATDGSDLGDVNWYTDEVIPSTDFEDPYSFASNVAQLSGNIGLNGNNHIQYNASGAPGTATWKIQAERACTLRVSVNMESGSDSGHEFTVNVRDNEKSLLTQGSVNELETSWSDGDIALFGRIVIPAAGDYYVELANATTNSGAKVEGLTFTYAGGNIKDIPTTLYPLDALLSDSAWIEGSPKYINFKKWGNAKYNSTEFAKWRVNVTTAGLYTFTANVNSTNGQYYGIYILSSDESSTVGSKEGTSDLGTGAKQFSTSPIDLTVGEYVVKIVNLYPNSAGRVLSIDAIYEGGNAIDIPAELEASDAILSPGASCSAGVITVPSWSTGWVKWRTHVTETEDLYYDIKLNVLSDSGNGHNFSVAIYKDESADPVATVSEGSWRDVSGTLNLGRVALEGSTDYVLKVTNAISGSAARITGAEVAYAGGKTIAIPGILYGADAVLEKTDPSTKMMIRLDNGDIQSSNNANHLCEYAYWKVHAKVGEMTVVLNIPETSTSQHQYEVALYNALNDAEPVIPAITETKTGSTGLFTIATTLNITTEGDYFIKLVNTVQYSSSTIRSISIAPAITIDEEATSVATVIEPNDGKVVNAQLNRSFTAGMYNTICLPFNVSAAEMARVFPGAVVKELTSSSIEDGGFVLNLNFDAVDEMEAGVPYIINPAANISNPLFVGVTIDKTLRPKDSNNAYFVGNFVAGTIEASENNLFLGANNTLYFPTVDTEILGMRAYFQVHGATAGVIKRARIVENSQVVTEIELVKSQEPLNNGKVIENGQLIIIRDGVRYNVMGVKIQ